ncbi:hypothetical protein KAI58_03475 [Candidatus Gracilibacteria bacterium]|nr:hypothetical protein [Candidatus Gracilibacteria bacterium]
MIEKKVSKPMVETKVLTPRVLAKNIKGYLLLNYRIEEIKEGAFNQGVTEEIWDKAILILIRRSKIKKYIQKLVTFMIYFFVGVLFFYSYLWWGFSQSELQKQYTFVGFIKDKLPLSALKEIKNSKTVEFIDRNVELNPDLEELYKYVIFKGINDICSFEMFFDKFGQLTKSEVYFNQLEEQIEEQKVMEISKKGVFFYERAESKDFIEEVEWRNVFESIPTLEILKKFGNKMRQMTLSYKKLKKDKIEVLLSVIYEELDGDYKKTYMIFNENGIKTGGRGEILSLMIKASEVKVKPNSSKK